VLPSARSNSPSKSQQSAGPRSAFQPFLGCLLIRVINCLCQHLVKLSFIRSLVRLQMAFSRPNSWRIFSTSSSWLDKIVVRYFQITGYCDENFLKLSPYWYYVILSTGQSGMNCCVWSGHFRSCHWSQLSGRSAKGWSSHWHIFRHLVTSRFSCLPIRFAFDYFG